MQIKIVGRNNLKITEGIRQAIEDKLSFLNKFLKEETPVDVTVLVQKDSHSVQIVFPYMGELIKVSTESNDLYISIEAISNILRNKIAKIHDIKVNPNKLSINTGEKDSLEEDNNSKHKIIKRKSFSMKPMSEEEAILQMNLLGHNSFMFKNSDLDFAICLLYKRKDGNFGIIEGIDYEC